MANSNVQLMMAMQNGQFAEVAGILDRCELESQNPHTLLDWPHALHILGHVYNNNLEDARLVWKRLPDEVKMNNPELEASWKLLQYMWNKHYQGVWQALQSFPWSTQVRPLVDAAALKFRQHMLELLTRAYTEVTPARAASLLGLAEQDMLQLAQAEGWSYDAAAGMLTVVAKPAESRVSTSFEQLQQLTEYMVHLEH